MTVYDYHCRLYSERERVSSVSGCQRICRFYVNLEHLFLSQLCSRYSPELGEFIKANNFVNLHKEELRGGMKQTGSEISGVPVQSANVFTEFMCIIRKLPGAKKARKFQVSFIYFRV